LGFDFVAIQLKNREEQTIETIRGRGLNSEWFGLAKHTTKGDPALWDIQAHIVMNNPPRIEIIAGRDRRFDDYIFNKFGHKDQVRVFAPVILAPTELTLMSFRWNLLDQLSPNVDQPNGDRRTVLEIPIEDWSGTNGQPSEVIGTIEAGFYDSSRAIPEYLARQLAMTAGRRAGDLQSASLENVFRTITRSAMRVTRADAASLHFARVEDGSESDTKFVHYTYQAHEGLRLLTNPTFNGLGQEALQRRQTLFVPNQDLGRDEQHLREFYREAYDQGMRAVAVMPIFFREESELLFTDQDGNADKLEKQGLLYVGFAQTHYFTQDEIGWLELFGARAIEAIRHATYDTKDRDRARRLANMHHIAQSMAGDPASPFLLEEIAGVALNILAADIVSVYEYDEQEERLLSSRPTIAGRLIKPDLVTSSVDEISAPALLLKTPGNIYANNAISDPILSAKRGTDGFENSFVARERVKSSAALVLRGGVPEIQEKPEEEILGVMFVNYRTFHHFTAEDRKLAETLASTAAIAIRNRRRRAPTAEQLEKAMQTIEAVSKEAPGQAEIARAIERIDNRLDRLLTSPTLDNFVGNIVLHICDSDGNELPTEQILEDVDSSDVTATFVTAPEQWCQVIVRFETTDRVPASSGFQKPLIIKDGDSVERVTFEVMLDSNNITFAPDHSTIALKSHSDSSSLMFTFKSPQEAGKHDFLVEIGQKNRLIKIIPLSVTIRPRV
jgi:GAF domain-containing protein